MTKALLFTISLLVFSSSVVFAMKECGDVGLDCGKCHTLTVEEANGLLKDVGGGVKSVKLAPVKGLWELAVEKDGRQGVAYMNFSKKFIVAGPIFSIDALKSAVKSAPPAKKVDVAAIPLANSIVMGNPKGKKRLFVFTDPDCPYCGRQHAELKKLVEQDKDLVVYIKLFPLVSIHPKAYGKAQLILEQNSLALLDKAFAKEQLPEPAANTPSKAVDETMNLAQSIGIQATPTLVLPDGRVIAGYKDAAQLNALLAESK